MSSNHALSAKQLNSIQSIDANAWDALSDNSPLLSHAFLSALEASNSVGEGTGWYPCPLAIYDAQNALVGAMPLYLKTHSYGEYVFDWAWADAYQRNDMAYYPKIVSAIPFSPVTSARLLGKQMTVQALLVDALSQVLQSNQLSSAHILFPDTQNMTVLEDKNWLKRQGVQFRWENQDYQDFDDFLASLSRDKRKKIKQERKKVANAGVACRTILGQDATTADWDFFYACYCNTYAEHHSTPYLTRDFFTEIAQTLSQQILLITASMDGQPIACTLNFYNDDVLYGRYWGAMQFVSGLHFELCYYQAQIFCIEKGIRFFEGGAQGEHKLARGFTPRPTYSYHYIRDANFESAIATFLEQESVGIAAYTNELEERAPYKQLDIKNSKPPKIAT